jgi:hypothetical protein
MASDGLCFVRLLDGRVLFARRLHALRYFQLRKTAFHKLTVPDQYALD